MVMLHQYFRMPFCGEKFVAVSQIFFSWGGSYLAVFLCMMTLDQSVSGDYFWNSVADLTNSTAQDPERKVRAATITQTQIFCRIVLLISSSSFLAMIVNAVFTVRQLNVQGKKEKASKAAQSQLADLIRLLLNGKLKLSIENVAGLNALMLQIQNGNDPCLALLQTWHASFNVLAQGATQYANADLNLSRQISDKLSVLISEFRKIPKTQLFQFHSGQNPVALRETAV